MGRRWEERGLWLYMKSVFLILHPVFRAALDVYHSADISKQIEVVQEILHIMNIMALCILDLYLTI